MKQPRSSQQQQQPHGLLYTVLGAAVGTAAAYYYYFYKSSQHPRGSDNDKSTSENLVSNCIYLDYNGTTPVYKPVFDAMTPYFQHHYGNPSSSHIHGQEPRRAINQARRQLLQYLGKNTTDDSLLSCIWFTGCGTESDNLAIALAIQGHAQKKKKHVVTCNVEHPAIEGYLKELERQGIITVTYVPVQPDGRVIAQDMIEALTDDTILVTLMLANNESGALQPVQQVAEECSKRGIWCHTDAAQAAGKVDVANLVGKADMISIVGHKLGAPKGIACLYVSKECAKTLPHNHGILLIGGGQEFGRRGGTENTPYIVGFGVAAEMAGEQLATNQPYMEGLRRRLLTSLQQELGDQNVRANGPADKDARLPNTLSVGFKGVHSGDLLADIGHLVAASAGATCHSAGSVSSVLRAMKVPDEFARGTLRLSLGPKTTRGDIDRAAKIIAAAVKRQWEANKQATSQ